ncbi:MAG TPA: right-handed parallel beta-helix repeat-containing protein [Saprospiraceae bacterium]|nr:right-handed parallel beta-helix repeat-containing protein [Saprospiraceae bacterium]
MRLKNYAIRLCFIYMMTSLFLCWSQVEIQAQMSSVVTSLEDDEFAHPYDFQVTPDVDESTDGVCEDSLHRCTLRAALEEAGNLGLYADVMFGASGTLDMDESQGFFVPPDNSIISAIGVIVRVTANPTTPIFVIDNGVTIYGLHLANALQGIVIGGNQNLIGTVAEHKNFITNMTDSGILIAGDNNKIVGNIIGLDRDETQDGSRFGVFVVGKNNVIGGSLPDQGNVISGNDTGIGVYTIVKETYIHGNRIGTNRAGTQAAPNRIGIDNIGPNAIIGTDTPDGRNVISGNTESGILFGLDASNCHVVDNYIGTDISGTLSIPNRDGITIGPGSDTCNILHNLIKFNTQNGILVSGLNLTDLSTRHILISGNTIQENGNAGIAITGNATDNIIGSSLTESHDPNEISYNGQVGIVLVQGLGDPQRNTIRDNIFLDNTSYGIRIVSGQGGIQPPVFESYTDDGNTAIVVGIHNLAGATIDLYAGDSNQANRLEGIEWLGSGPVDGNGFFSIQISSCICDSIVATATDPMGNTSEFSDGIGTITGIYDYTSARDKVSAFPNPFNETTNIQVDLFQAGDVLLQLNDVAGYTLKTLYQGHLDAGTHRFNCSPDELAYGIYFYQLSIQNHVIKTGKLVYLR